MKIKELTIPIYNQKMCFVLPNNFDELKEHKYLKERYENEDYFFAETEYNNIEYNGTERNCIYIILNSKCKYGNLTSGIIAHEAFHAVNIIFKERGCELDRNNDESDAYLLAYIVDELHTFLKENKVKLYEKQE